MSRTQAWAGRDEVCVISRPAGPQKFETALCNVSFAKERAITSSDHANNLKGRPAYKGTVGKFVPPSRGTHWSEERLACLGAIGQWSTSCKCKTSVDSRKAWFVQQPG